MVWHRLVGNLPWRARAVFSPFPSPLHNLTETLTEIQSSLKLVQEENQCVGENLSRGICIILLGHTENEGEDGKLRQPGNENA
jgi:hypothetical protein